MIGLQIGSNSLNNFVRLRFKRFNGAHARVPCLTAVWRISIISLIEILKRVLLFLIKSVNQGDAVIIQN